MIDSLVPAPETVPQPTRRVARADEKPVRDFRESIGEQAREATPQPSGIVAEAVEDTAAKRVDGGGQSLLLPWQLVANNALSHVFMQSAATVELAHSGAMATAPAAFVRTGAFTLPYAAAAVAGGTAGGAAPLPTVATTAPRAAAMPGSEPSAASSDASAALASLAERWQQRLLRWSANGAQGLSVRVRDFRLDAAGEQALAQRLRAFANEHGLALQRIVINARELWNAGTPIPSQSGDAHGR